VIFDSGKSGGLNGSAQHEPEIYLKESRKPKSFASGDSNEMLPCLVLIEHNWRQIGSLAKALSGQLIIWCCIDLLNAPA